jgi:hypothetical protein
MVIFRRPQTAAVYDGLEVWLKEKSACLERIKL